MKKIVLTVIVFCVFVSTTVHALAQAPAQPPIVLHIVREDIKTGMMGAHSIEANKCCPNLCQSEIAISSARNGTGRGQRE